MLRVASPNKAESSKAAAAPAVATPDPASTGIGELAFDLFTRTSDASEREREANAAAAGVVGQHPGSGGDGASDGAGAGSARGGPFGVVVDDHQPVAEGQVHRTPFLDNLGAEIERLADRELSVIERTALDCPYLQHWIEFYRDRPAAQVERAIQRYARPERIDLEGIREAVLRRVRQAVVSWISSGGSEVQSPEGVEWLGDTDRVPEVPASGNGIQRQPANGDSPALPSDPREVQAQLAPGQALEPRVRSRMEQGFGASFIEVRVHADAGAENLADRFDARAFTVGSDVAFAPRQYRPGTLEGDALIAHELAHVLQQRGARHVETHSGTDHGESERSADQAAVNVLTDHTAAAGGGTGLRLARCGGMEDPPHQEWREHIPDEAVSAVDRLRVLHTEQQQLLSQPGMDQAKAIRLARISEEMSELVRVLQRAGFQGDEAQALSHAVAGGPAFEVTITALTGATPSTMIWGERRRFDIEVGFLPPGVDVLVSWYCNDGHTQFEFGHSRQRDLALTLDERFWEEFLLQEDLRRRRGESVANPGFSLTAKTFVANDPTPSSQQTTPWISVQDALPSTLSIESQSIMTAQPQAPTSRPLNPAQPPARPPRPGSGPGGYTGVSEATGGVVTTAPTVSPAATDAVLQGAQIDFRLSWIPPGIRGRTPSYVTAWYLENESIATDRRYKVIHPPQFEYRANWMTYWTFGETGTFLVHADVHQVTAEGHRAMVGNYARYSRTPALAATRRVRVRTASEVGADALKTYLSTTPPPEYGSFLTDLDAQLGALEKTLAQGSLAPEAFRTQRENLTEVRTRILDLMGGREAVSLPASGPLDESVNYAIPVAAVFSHPQFRGAQPLSVFIRLHKDGANWRANLVDATTQDVIGFEGTSADPEAAVRAALARWQTGNEYPQNGSVHYQIHRWGLADHFSTNATRKTVKEWFDRIVFVVTSLVGVILLLVPEPTGLTKAAGIGLLLVGIANSAYNIYRNLQLQRPVLSQANILEAISILSAFLGIRGAQLAGPGAQALARGEALAGQALSTFRLGRGMVISSVAADAGTFVWVSNDGLRQLEAMANDPSIPDHEKEAAFFQTLGQIATQALLMVGHNRDLFARPTRPGMPHQRSLVDAMGGDLRLNTAERTRIETALRQHGVHDDLSRLGDRELINRYAEVRQAFAAADQAAATVSTTTRPAGAVRGVGIYDMQAAPGNVRPIDILKTFRGPTRRARLGGKARLVVTTAPTRNDDFGAAHLEVDLPGPPARTITCQLRFDLSPDLTTTRGAHGAESGPARLNVSRDPATGDWHATITLDSRLGRPPSPDGKTPGRSEDIGQVVGHELDEVASIIQRVEPGTRPGQDVSGRIAGEQTAGAFHPTSRSSRPNSHDIAAAHELQGLLAEVRSDLVTAATAKSPTTAQRARSAAAERRLDALLDSMGFRDPTTRPLRLAALDTALGGIPVEMGRYIEFYGRRINTATRVAGYRASPDFARLPPGTSQVTDDFVDHLVNPGLNTGHALIPPPAVPMADFQVQGISGGHLESSLYAHVGSQAEYQVGIVREKSAGGTVYRLHVQYRRQAGSTAAPPPRDLTAAATGAGDWNQARAAVPTPAGWVQANIGKTTARDLNPFLASVDTAFNAWLASPAGRAFATSTAERFVIGEVGTTAPMSADGVDFGGAAVKVGGRIQLRSAWIEASWFFQ